MTPEQRFQYAVDVLLKHEGGFSNDKADPGGATMYGVSLRYLKIAGIDINLDGKIDISDIMALDKAHAIEIYRKNWWDKYGYEKIDDLLVATKVFDLAVNMGAPQAHKLVQRASNTLSSFIEEVLVVDGVLGKKSIDALNELWRIGKNDELLLAIKKQASQFYSNLVESKPELAGFLKGWLRRAND
jgi:lysozyme family protein